MLFYVLDIIFWQYWSLLTWSIQYLGPLILLVQLVRMIRADADLNLLMYEKFGMKPNSLRGQVVWITGASSGIGEHLAYVLAKSGCKLCLSARREKELDRVKQACLEYNGAEENDIFVLPFDLIEIEKHQELVEKVIGYFGHIDILVNNAARTHHSFIRDTPLQVARELLELVVIAQIALTKAVLPHFIQRQTGQFVVTNSISGKFSSAALALYNSGKFALMGYFDALRIEHARDNIAVTHVCPGPVASSIADNIIQVPGQQCKAYPGGIANVMPAERCAHLMAVAMANRLGEVWISRQPCLLFIYLSQYCPGLWRWIAVRTGQSVVSKRSDLFNKMNKL